MSSLPRGPAGPPRRPRAGSGLDKRGHTHTEVTALRSRLGLPPPERGYVDKFGEPVQRFPRRDPGQRTAGQHDGRRIGPRSDVTQPDLQRDEAELFRDEVEGASPHECLGRPRAAVGDIRRLVRRDRC
jgi:hypothetical protein